MLKNIFICYRRDDAAGYSRSIYDRVNARFPGRVFMDVTGITPGSDYSRVIQDTVGSCHALLAIIGKTWLTMADDSNRRRLDLADDYVRHEIATALKRNIAVIPVLVRGAQMPSTAELPPDLAALSLREAVEITDTDFDHDVQRLIYAIERQFGEVRQSPPPVAPRARNNCLIFGLIGALVVGAIVVVLFLLGLLAASTNQDGGGVQPSQPVYQPSASNPAPTNQPPPVSSGVDFQPVGHWMFTLEQEEGANNLEVFILADKTFKSRERNGTWEYDPDEQKLKLSGGLTITIERQLNNVFEGHVDVDGENSPVTLRRLGGGAKE
ncbi:MAG TPA: toll/interleukin-1 receptor domain-containing protein [Pyrinomonadaceae bacterium]